MDDENALDHGRRTSRREIMKKAGIVAGVAWTAPVVLTAYSPAFGSIPCPCGYELVTNGNASAGLTGWTPSGTPTTISGTGGPGGYPTSPVGDPYFMGGEPTGPFGSIPAATVSTLTQTIAINTCVGKEYVLSAWLGGYLNQADNARVVATFLNGSGAQVGLQKTIGPVTNIDRGGASGFLFRSNAASIPPDTVPLGAVSVRIQIIMRRVTDNWNDGYADNVSFQIKCS